MIIQIKRLLSSSRFLTGAVVCLSLVASGCETTKRGGYAVERDPTAARDAYIELGSLHLKDDERERAKGRFLKAIEIDEDAAGAYTGLAVIYERSKEYDQAEAYYKKAVSVDSTFTAAKVQYGWFLLTQKRYDDACDMLEEATEDKLADQRHVALYYLGRCEALRANHKGAIDSLGLATRVQRNFAPAWLELGASNYQLGEIEEASYALNQFRRYSADNADSLLLSVKLGLAQGDTDLVHSSSRKLEVHFPESAQWKEIEQLVK